MVSGRSRMPANQIRRAAPAIVLLLLLGCGAEEQQFPNYSPADGNPALVTPEDIRVYEAVISGYAHVGQVLMLLPPPGPPPGSSIPDPNIEGSGREHVVRMRPYTSKAGDVTPEPDRWWTLDRKKLPRLAVPESAITNLTARNARHASLRALRPKHLRIEWSDTMTTMNCLYSLTLPGYSRSGDEAIVEISCGTWALAGGGELLYLRRNRGTWRVVAKQQTWIS